MSITQKIINRIKQNNYGWVFSPSDFLDISTRAAADKVLSRLVKQGMIRRLDRGIYDYPKEHRLLGVLSPNPDSLARVLAAGDKVFPSGAAAANILGLSTQVPAKTVYLTNFTTKKRVIGNQTIILRRARIPLFKNISYKSNLVLQALSYLGKLNIDNLIINRCASILTKKDLKLMRESMKRIPGWLTDIMHKIEDAEDGQIQRSF